MNSILKRPKILAAIVGAVLVFRYGFKKSWLHALFWTAGAGAAVFIGGLVLWGAHGD